MIILIIFRIQLSTSIGNAGDERPAGGSPAHARPIDWARDVAADRYNVIPGRTHARTRIVDALRSHRPRENDVDDGRRATGDRTARPSSDEQTDQRRFTERRTARRAVRYGRPTSFAPHHDYSYDEVYKSETVNTLSTNWAIVSYFYNTIFTPIRTVRRIISRHFAFLYAERVFFGFCLFIVLRCLRVDVFQFFSAAYVQLILPSTERWTTLRFRRGPLPHRPGAPRTATNSRPCSAGGKRSTRRWRTANRCRGTLTGGRPPKTCSWSLKNFRENRSTNTRRRSKSELKIIVVLVLSAIRDFPVITIYIKRAYRHFRRSPFQTIIIHCACIDPWK